MKIFLRKGSHILPCPIPFCDESERVESIVQSFSDALALADDVFDIGNHIVDKFGYIEKYMIATVGHSTFFVVSGKHGNILLEGLVVKLNTLKKAASFVLAKNDVNIDVLPKSLRGQISNMKEFLKK